MKALYKIGITGGIASGKSTLVNYLARIKGIKTLQLDLVAHDLYRQSAHLRSKIKQEFGENCLTPDGLNINRAELGKLVFKDKERLDTLNSIVWPELQFYSDFLVSQIEQHKRDKYDIIAIQGAIILQAGWDHKFDEMWGTVVRDVEEIKRRIKERNKQQMDEEMIENLVEIQRRHNAEIEQKCSFWYDTTESAFKGENELKVLKKLERLRDMDILRG